MTLNVQGMTCHNCVRHVREALEAVEGASNVTVDLETGVATVDGISAEAAIAAIEEEGYQASEQ
jgi:copper chaperone